MGTSRKTAITFKIWVLANSRSSSECSGSSGIGWLLKRVTLCDLRDLLFKNVFCFLPSYCRRSEEKSSAQKIAKITKKKLPAPRAHQHNKPASAFVESLGGFERRQRADI